MARAKVLFAKCKLPEVARFEGLLTSADEARALLDKMEAHAFLADRFCELRSEINASKDTPFPASLCPSRTSSCQIAETVGDSHGRRACALARWGLAAASPLRG